MKIKSVLLLCFCLFTSQYLHAQTIKGKLVDAKTNQNVSFANLTLVHQDQPTLIKNTNSDTLGLFEFKEVPNGKYILSATLIGYQKLHRELIVNKNDSKTLSLGNVLINEDLNLLKEISVTSGTPNFSAQNGQIKISIANNPFFKSFV